MKQLKCIIFLLLPVLAMGQEDSLSPPYSWNKVGKYKVDKGENWSADALGNVYVVHKSSIDKFDSAGVLKFSQSIKSFGRMKQFVPINTMKLVHFSEDQQTICYFDNTLTASENCIDLADKEVFNASLICASDRSDKLWVYDNLNSSLRLIDTEGKAAQEIRIDNLKGILGIENVVQIKERYDQLYVLDSEKGVYIFDIYGTLVGHYDIEGGLSIDANNNMLFVLTEDGLFLKKHDNGSFVKLDVPVKDIESFQLESRTFYMRTPEIVHKYRLQISN